MDAYAGMASQTQLGDSFAPGIGMAPLAMARQLERVQAYIERDRTEGATMQRGGGRPSAGSGNRASAARREVEGLAGDTETKTIYFA